jgi:hypothetical protein
MISQFKMVIHLICLFEIFDIEYLFQTLNYIFSNSSQIKSSSSSKLSEKSASGCDLNDYSSSSPSKSSNDYLSPPPSGHQIRRVQFKPETEHPIGQERYEDSAKRDFSTQMLGSKLNDGASSGSGTGFRNNVVIDDDEDEKMKHVTKLFVGNLPTSTTLAELLTVFKKFGPVNEKLSVVKDQNYALVTSLFCFILFLKYLELVN